MPAIRPRADEGSSPSVVPTILIHVAQPRPRRTNTRNSIAFNNHEQPLVGESLFASTGPAGQALSPPS